MGKQNKEEKSWPDVILDVLTNYNEKNDFLDTEDIHNIVVEHKLRSTNGSKSPSNTVSGTLTNMMKKPKYQNLIEISDKARAFRLKNKTENNVHKNLKDEKESKVLFLS